MKDANNMNTAVFLSALLLISFAAVSQGAYLKYSVPKSSYQVGEKVGVDFEVTNPTSEEKTFTCVVSYDPPTSKNPYCRTVDIKLKPGETYKGSLGEIAEFPANSKVTIKLIDPENPDVILENYSIDVKVTSSREPVCGDLICESPETFQACPEDCRGAEDGVCDGFDDGVCDPDCEKEGTPEKDPDCACNKDGTCGKGENYVNCPSDCASGTADGYCDKAGDGKCDPDCRKEEDPDCGGGITDFMGYVPYIAALLIVAAALFFIYKKSEDKKIAKEREEFNKWKEEGGG